MGWGGARPNSGPRKRKLVQDAAPKPAPAAPRPRPMFSDDAIGRVLRLMEERDNAARNRPRTRDWCPYVIDPSKFGPVARHIPRTLAMDSNAGLVSQNTIAVEAWMAGGMLGAAVSQGLLFLGYPYLSELSQRPEYRLFGEIRAQEMTRAWIRIRGTDDASDQDEDQPNQKNDEDEGREQERELKGEKPRNDERNKELERKIKELEDFLDSIKLRDWFKTAAAQDAFFGISHLFLDFADVDIENPRDEEIKAPVGNGRNEATLVKFGGRKDFFRGVRTIEPIWCYPTTYNSAAPLVPSWYNPQVWYVMGIEIASTRFLSFIGRPVPDILKPAYAFGGLALTQMAQPYVDIWLRTRQSVGEIIHAFSVMVLKTNLGTATMPGSSGGAGWQGDLLTRLGVFAWARDNQGVFAIDKATEDFANVSAPLGGLDDLQAQAQEHMCSVARIPVVKFTGLQPKGLNATSEGEMRAFEETIVGEQEHLFRPNLTTVLDFAMISLWGERDPDITFEFVPLREMTPKEKAEIRKLEAETDQIRIDSGVVWQEEARSKLANDPESGFDDLDPHDVPDLLQEEEQGLEPKEGRPQPQAEVGEEEEGGGGKQASKPAKPAKDGGIQNFDDMPTEGEANRQARVTGGGRGDGQTTT
jgi:uncharacterized protein